MNIENQLPSLANLPDTYGVFLSGLSAISVSGEERDKYLQGQVTCDVNKATENTLMNGAHCDAKGKTLSAFRLIRRLSSSLLLQPKCSLASSLAALQKFGVFAKVTIEEAKDLNIFALVGEQSADILLKKFTQVPDSLSPVVQIDSTTLVYIAGQQKRYLVIDDINAIESFVESINLTIFPYTVWELLEIREGFPLLNELTVNQYVPQMLNIQAINGISFTKGCYLGQETVARMQYLGKNKRALYSLAGSSLNPVSAEDIIEIQMGENWRKAGDVLAYYQAEDGSVYLQAILNSDITADTHLRLKNTERALNVVALPYSLN